MGTAPRDCKRAVEPPTCCDRRGVEALAVPRAAKRNIADCARELGAAELRLTGASVADLYFSIRRIWESGGLDLIHGSDTESLHDLRHSDTMVMNTAQMSRQID